MRETNPQVWVIKPGEPAVHWPGQPFSRELRSARLARALAEGGTSVTLFTSSFQHHSKKQIVDRTSFATTNIQNLNMVLVASPGYGKHLSLSRFWDHMVLGINLYLSMRRLPPPSLIVCSWPPIETAFISRLYAYKHGIPFLLDVRDLWPETIYRRLSKWSLIRLFRLLFIYEFTAKFVFRTATSLIGVTDGFVKWACIYSNRQRDPRDISVPLTGSPIGKIKYTKADVQYWDELGVEDDDKIRFILVGTLMDQYVLRAFISIIEELDPFIKDDFQFVICGSGDLKELVKTKSETIESMIFGGFVDANRYAALCSRSHLGLILYDNSFDFKLSVPNKVGEYLSAGLHIVSSISGEIDKFVPSEFLHPFVPEPVSFYELLFKIKPRFIENEQQKVEAKMFWKKSLSDQHVFNKYRKHCLFFAR